MAFGSKGNISGVPVSNMKAPADGGQASFLGLFNMPATVTFELNKFEQGSKVELPQTLFFDASTSTGDVTIVFSGTQQTLVLPPQSQGYIPILTPDEPSFTISGAGGGAVGLTFVSVPLPSHIWSVAAGGASTVTAAQGLPNTVANAWPVELAQGGALNSPTNPIFVENTAAEADPTYSPSASPPVSNVGAATDIQLIGGEVYTITNAAVGSQLPLALTSSGQLLVSDQTAETNLTNILNASPITGTADTPITAAATSRTTMVGGFYEPYGSFSAPAAGQFAGFGVTLNRELLVSDHAAEASLVTISSAVGNSGGSAQSPGVQILGTYRASPVAANPGDVYIPTMDANANLQATEMSVVTLTPSEQAAGSIIQGQATPYGARIVDTETLTPSYNATAGITVAASAASVPAAWIRGSASKVVRIKRVIVQGQGLPSTASSIALTLVRYSGATAFAGSGVTVVPVGPFDINDPVGTAVVSNNQTGAAITASPTTGNPFRTVSILQSANDQSFEQEWDFLSGTKSLVLRGTSDWFCIIATNTGTAAIGGSFSIDWTEV
jgi:hypothetical protein